ncbi:MAG: protein kinase, partial [Sandaracinaceae bacterium]
MLQDVTDLPRPFGPYVLQRRLAVGGAAVLYAATARGVGGTEQPVMVQRIHPQLEREPAFVRALLEEGQATLTLQHANIVRTYDVGFVDGATYLATELVEGADGVRLEGRARELGTPLPIDVALHVAIEVCRGLAYAHRRLDGEGRPFAHGDVSPRSVAISVHGEVKIGDFALSRAARRRGHSGPPGRFAKDPAPSVDGDLVGVGLLLSELLTGVMVDRDDSAPSLLEGLRRAHAEGLKASRPDVPDDLAQLVRRVTGGHDPELSSADALGQALTRVLNRIDPALTPGRLATLMAQLFPESSPAARGPSVPSPAPPPAGAAPFASSLAPPPAGAAPPAAAPFASRLAPPPPGAAPPAAAPAARAAGPTGSQREPTVAGPPGHGSAQGSAPSAGAKAPPPPTPKQTPPPRGGQKSRGPPPPTTA